MTLSRTDTTIAGPHGPVGVRLYEPSELRGIGVVWIHGGAFHLNDLDVPEAEWVSTRFAEAGVTVVSVDYRLANDGVHFPVPSDDCVAAWRWATETADLGVPAGSWHVGGGSAGGNLAASVSLQAVEHGLVLPRTEVLIYPVLHSELPAPSAELAVKVAALAPEQSFLPEESLDINLNYVGDPANLTHPHAFPAYGSLEGMPPTLIVNSDADLLRASGEEFGAQLVRAGVDTTVIREVGVLHGHLNEPETPGARRTVERMIDWLTSSALVGTAHEAAAAGGDRILRSRST